MTERLTLRGVIAANRKALADGTLLAMSPRPPSTCLYVHDGYRCAVGAALPDDVIQRLRGTDDNFANVYSCRLVSNLLPPHGTGEDEMIADLQTIHDNWAHSYPVGTALAFVDSSHPLADQLRPIRNGPDSRAPFDAGHYARVLDALEAWADANLEEPA